MREKIEEINVSNNNDNISISPEVLDSPQGKEVIKDRENFKNQIIGISVPKENRDEAFNLALKYICNNKQENCSAKIKKYEKDHGLTIDKKNPKVGPEVYMELKAEKVLEQASNKFDEFGLSVKTLKEINNILPKLSKNSYNKAKLLSYVAKFKSDSKFAEKRKNKDIEKELDKLANYSKGQIQNIQNSKEAKSIYGTIKDISNGKISVKEGVKKIMTDPTLLMVGGLLFLFGVIGGDYKYTNTFFKRLGWILGVSLFGKALWNKIGIGEMIDDAVDSATKPNGTLHKAGQAIKKSAETTKEATTNFITETIPKTWKNIKKFYNKTDFSKIWKNITKSAKKNFNKLTNDLSSYNKTLNNSDDINKYIKPETFKILNSELLFQDKKLANVKKDDLGSISVLSTCLEESTIKELEAKGVKKDDIVKFLNNHLKHMFSEHKNAEYVGELFWTKELYKEFLEKTIKTNGKYVEDENLNKKLNELVRYLINSNYYKQQQAGIDLYQYLKGKETNFDPKNYGIESLKIGSEEITDILEEFKNYQEQEKEYKKAISKIKKIEVGETATQQNFSDYLNSLSAITFSGVSLGLQNKFEEEKNKKLQEILKQAEKNGFGNIQFNYGRDKIKPSEYLEKLKKEMDKIKDKKTLEEIKEKLPAVPSTNATPKEFLAWWEKYKGDFDRTMQILNLYTTDGEITSLVSDILTKKVKFIENYKKVRNKYIKKIEKLTQGINNINSSNLDTNKLIESKEKLKAKQEEYKKLLNEIESNLGEKAINKLKGIFKSLQSIASDSITVPEIKLDTFDKLDGELQVSGNAVNVNALSQKIIKKNYEIENAYQIPSNITLANLEEAKGIIDQFDNESIKKVKYKILKGKINILISNYIKELNSATTMSQLLSIKQNYDAIINKFDHKINIGTFMVDLVDNTKQNEFEEAYDNKMEELNPLNNRKIESINGLVNKVINLINNYPDMKGKELLTTIDTKKQVYILKRVLKSLKKLNKNNSNLLSDINNILDIIK